MRFLQPILVALALTSSLEAACSSPKMRKEIRELTNDEYNRYIKAVLALNKRNSSTSLSTWETFAKVHYDGANRRKQIHGCPAFLPWHRKFIKNYELELQKIDPSVDLPYWDWSQDYREPHKSSVLTPKYVGGNGNRNKNMLLDNGPFNNTQLIYSNKHTLKRDYDRGDSISSFTSPTELQYISNEAKFSNFAARLESAHGAPHYKIGGDYDFGVYTSPNDPIFFLHHAFIDLLWAKWQDKSGNSNKYEGENHRMTVKATDKVYGYTDTVASTFNYKSGDYCYNYPEFPRKINAVRTNEIVARDLIENRIAPKDILLKLTRGMTLDTAITTLQKISDRFGVSLPISDPEVNDNFVPMPDSWITANDLNKDEVRKFEANQIKLRILFKKLNPIVDKISLLSY